MTTATDGEGDMSAALVQDPIVWTTTTVWVCVDCMLSVAGYSQEETGSEPEREPLSSLAGCDVTAGMAWADHADDCPNRLADERVDECECEHDTFSRAQCGGCGSWLAGDRFGVTVWE